MTPENTSPAELTIEVYTTPLRTFTSSVTPEGPGDEPTWSPMSAALIPILRRADTLLPHRGS